jgi:serine/threonine protein kinase
MFMIAQGRHPFDDRALFSLDGAVEWLAPEGSRRAYNPPATMWTADTSPRVTAPGVHESVRALISRMLAFDPAERPYLDEVLDLLFAHELLA